MDVRQCQDAPIHDLTTLLTANLLIASMSLQFIVWIFAQVACVASTPNQTVIVVQNQVLSPPPPSNSPALHLLTLISSPPNRCRRVSRCSTGSSSTLPSPHLKAFCNIFRMYASNVVVQPMAAADTRPVPPGWEVLTDTSGNR